MQSKSTRRASKLVALGACAAFVIAAGPADSNPGLEIADDKVNASAVPWAVEADVEADADSDAADDDLNGGGVTTQGWTWR